MDVGSNTTYSLTPTDVLFVDTGTYTGTIDDFPSGAVICVDTGAVFQPSALNGAVSGSVYVRRTANFPGGGLAGGFALDPSLTRLVSNLMQAHPPLDEGSLTVQVPWLAMRRERSPSPCFSLAASIWAFIWSS